MQFTYLSNLVKIMNDDNIRTKNFGLPKLKQVKSTNKEIQSVSGRSQGKLKIICEME